MPLRAIALNCTLKDDPSEASSTDAMIAVLKKAFAEREVVVTETVRVATLDIKPGDGFDQFQGPAENPRQGDQDGEDGREQRRTPRRTAQGRALSRLMPQMLHMRMLRMQLSAAT